MLLLAVVLFSRALDPMAILLPPVVLSKSVICPRPRLLLPVVLFASALEPKAVFELPVVLSCRAALPTAAFDEPDVLFSSAVFPTARFPLAVVAACNVLNPIARFDEPVVVVEPVVVEPNKTVITPRYIQNPWTNFRPYIPKQEVVKIEQNTTKTVDNTTDGWITVKSKLKKKPVIIVELCRFFKNAGWCRYGNTCHRRH